jgi:hypothetical protein
MMRTGEIERSQSGADNMVAKLLHQAWLAGWMLIKRWCADRDVPVLAQQALSGISRS